MADGIFYETTSAIDGAPIVLILRGRKDALAERDDSANEKTGAMIQSYIMRADVAPMDALRSGEDSSVCGDCVHRPHVRREAKARGEAPGAPCYVKVWHGPRVCFEAYKRGSYRRATSLLDLAAYCEGLPTRFGTYGDPGALPAYLWGMLAHAASERTGYTHRWGDTGAELRGLVMASVDSTAERDRVERDGWAWFRVANTIEEGAERVRGEARCPASAEAGKRVTCRTCPLKCNGEGGGGRVILDHGPGGIGRKQ